MSLKVEGTIHKIMASQEVNATFKKREFVIETDEKYPQLVKFELVQDRCDLISSYKVGDIVEVEFNLKGREWNEKYFTNLHAWRITGKQVSGNSTQEPPIEPVNAAELGKDDDLPF